MIQSTYSVSQHTQICFSIIQLYVPVSIFSIDGVDKGSQLIRVYLLK